MKQAICIFLSLHSCAKRRILTYIGNNAASFGVHPRILRQRPAIPVSLPTEIYSAVLFFAVLISPASSKPFLAAMTAMISLMTAAAAIVP